MPPLSQKAIYPGSFDILTFGHLDIIERGAAMAEELIVGVGDNPAKSPLFPRGERLRHLRDATAYLPNVRAEAYEGLTVDFALEHGATLILRGLRFVSDFEFELQFAMANGEVEPGIETIFLAPSPQFSYISSSMVRQLAARGRDVTKFVPANVAEALARVLADG